MNEGRAAVGLMVASVLLGGGVGASYESVTHTRGEVSRTQIASRPPSRPVEAASSISRGGQELRFEVNLVPDAVVKTGASEAIEYHAELTSRLDEGGTAAWTALVVSDTGDVAETLSTGQNDIGANSVAETSTFLSNVGDGYYSLRVRAAIHATSWDDIAEGVVYFVVEGGKMSEMSYDDWRDESRATLAHPGDAVAQQVAASATQVGSVQ